MERLLSLGYLKVRRHRAGICQTGNGPPVWSAEHKARHKAGRVVLARAARNVVLKLGRS